MLRQNETGVLSGSEVYFHSISPTAQRLLYFVNCCGRYYCERGYQVRRQYMESLLVILVEKGALEMTYEGENYTALEGDILVLDGTLPQYYTTAEYADFYWLHIAGMNSFELCEHLTRLRGGILHRLPSDPKPASAIRLVVSQFATAQTIDEVDQSWLLYGMLCSLIRASQANAVPKAAGEASAVQQTVQFIHAHLGEDLCLKRLAARLNISPAHLIRLFRAEMNASPHEYIVQMRMNRARYLLKNTDLPVKLVAAEVGYRLETSFTAAFTERIGISPRKFRALPLG